MPQTATVLFTPYDAEWLSVLALTPPPSFFLPVKLDNASLAISMRQAARRHGKLPREGECR